jgi:hypothetical protein
MLGSSWVAAQLAASQEGLGSSKIGSESVISNFHFTKKVHEINA